MTGRRTTIVDGEGYRWIPSETYPGMWDLDPVKGVYRYTGWPRESIEAMWPPILDVSEPTKVAS